MTKNLRFKTGKIIDEYFRGASWANTWDEAQQYVDEEVEETFEYCETIYTKNALSKNATATVNEYELTAKVIFKIQPNNKKFIFTQKKIIRNMDNNSDERDTELAIKQTFANIITNDLIESLISSF